MSVVLRALPIWLLIVLLTTPDEVDGSWFGIGKKKSSQPEPGYTNKGQQQQIIQEPQQPLELSSRAKQFVVGKVKKVANWVTDKLGRAKKKAIIVKDGALQKVANRLNRYLDREKRKRHLDDISSYDDDQDLEDGDELSSTFNNHENLNQQQILQQTQRRDLNNDNQNYNVYSKFNIFSNNEELNRGNFGENSHGIAEHYESKGLQSAASNALPLYWSNCNAGINAAANKIDTSINAIASAQGLAGQAAAKSSMKIVDKNIFAPNISQQTSQLPTMMSNDIDSQVQRQSRQLADNIVEEAFGSGVDRAELINQEIVSKIEFESIQADINRKQKLALQAENDATQSAQMMANNARQSVKNSIQGHYQKLQGLISKVQQNMSHVFPTGTLIKNADGIPSSGSGIVEKVQSNVPSLQQQVPNIFNPNIVQEKFRHKSKSIREQIEVSTGPESVEEIVDEVRRAAKQVPNWSQGHHVSANNFNEPSIQGVGLEAAPSTSLGYGIVGGLQEAVETAPVSFGVQSQAVNNMDVFDQVKEEIPREMQNSFETIDNSLPYWSSPLSRSSFEISRVQVDANPVASEIVTKIAKEMQKSSSKVLNESPQARQSSQFQSPLDVEPGSRIETVTKSLEDKRQQVQTAVPNQLSLVHRVDFISPSQNTDQSLQSVSSTFSPSSTSSIYNHKTNFVQAQNAADAIEAKVNNELSTVSYGTVPDDETRQSTPIAFVPNIQQQQRAAPEALLQTSTSIFSATPKVVSNFIQPNATNNSSSNIAFTNVERQQMQGPASIIPTFQFQKRNNAEIGAPIRLVPSKKLQASGFASDLSAETVAFRRSSVANPSAVIAAALPTFGASIASSTTDSTPTTNSQATATRQLQQLQSNDLFGQVPWFGIPHQRPQPTTKRDSMRGSSFGVKKIKKKKRKIRMCRDAHVGTCKYTGHSPDILPPLEYEESRLAEERKFA